MSDLNKEAGTESESVAALKEVCLLALKEARSARRWRTFFRSLILILILLFILPILWQNYKTEHKNHVLVLQLNGVISTETTFNAHDAIAAINAAMLDPHTKALVLSLNSPGGSPVQSARIYDAILKARQKQPNKPIYAVVNDLCASGCYYVASAATKIFVNKTSLVGSIGVIMRSFGMVDSIKKVGIENRTMAAGKNKNMLDPFEKIQPAHLRIERDILEKAHKIFISDVRNGRAGKLKETPDVFSGLVWIGVDAVKLGLADSLGTIESVKATLFPKDSFVYQSLEDWSQSVAKKLGYEFSNEIADQYLTAKMH